MLTAVGATDVLADDGRFYRDPVLRGDGWFLCFGEGDPPELVFAVDRPVTASESRRRATNLTTRLGLCGSLGRGPRQQVRIFGPDVATSPRLLSHAWFIDLAAPVPRRLIDAGARGRLQPCGDGEYYDFGAAWG